MWAMWIRDICDCNKDRLDLDPDTIEVLKTIYNETKKISPLGDFPPTESSEESSEDEDYVIEDKDIDSSESEEEELSEDDYVDSEGEEEIIIKRDKSGFYYLY